MNTTRTNKKSQKYPSPLFEAVFFPLIKQIRLGRSQIDDLGTAIPVLLHLGAFLAVVGVGDPWTPADGAATLVAAKIALVAYFDLE